MNYYGGKITSYAVLMIVLLFLFFGPVGSASAVTCCKCTTKDDPKTNICIKTVEQNCASMPEKSSNTDVKELNCVQSLGDPDKGQCQSISDGGICATAPQEEFLYKPVGRQEDVTHPGALFSTPKVEKPILPPILGIQIPGLQLTTIVPKDGILEINHIGQYIAAVYKYLTAIAVVAAAVMITYGGFRYITGASMGSVQRGKEIIRDALIGLMLVLGAYTVLTTINPNLVSLKLQEIPIIGRMDSFSDPAKEKQRIIDTATVLPAGTEEMPVIEILSPERTKAITEGRAVPEEQVPAQEITKVLAPGTIVQDKEGRPIPQGGCPDSMVPIKKSGSYQPVAELMPYIRTTDVDSFCMDRFEAPNQLEVKPLLGATEWEAEWYCNERGKRLCTTNEWIRACLGPNGKNNYGYGPDFIPGEYVTKGNPPSSPQWYALIQTGNEPGKCNYDTPAKRGPYWSRLQNFYILYPVKEEKFSILNPENPRLAESSFKKLFDIFLGEIDALNESEPSGSRLSCVTAEGVFDMPGNVSEMTVKTEYAQLTTEQRVAMGQSKGSTKPYSWMGFYWAPIAHKDTSQATPSCIFGANKSGFAGVGGVHEAGGWRDYANGFRCCTNLDD